MARSGRLLDLIQALRRHRHPVTAATLAAELGVSLRTLYRDVATLRASGAPIEGEAGLGYVLAPGFVLPPLMFTDEEIEALVLGLRFVAQRTDGALARAALDATGKITAVLPSEMRERAGEVGLLVGPAFAEAETVPIATLREVIRREHRLRLSYRDLADRASERVVWPVALGFFDRARVLIAWCELRADFRHFRADRIVAAEVLTERFPRRRAVLLAEWHARERVERGS